MLNKIMKVITVIVAILLIGYIIVLKMPGASADSKESVANISAQVLYEEYNANEKAAQGKYLGKAVVVTGVLYDKYEDETGAPVVLLGPAEGDPYVLATLESSESNNLKAYEIGSTIKVKGLCSGLLMEVTLSKGIIEE